MTEQQWQKAVTENRGFAGAEEPSAKHWASLVPLYREQSASMLDFALTQSGEEARAYLVKCAVVLAQNADALEALT